MSIRMFFDDRLPSRTAICLLSLSRSLSICYCEKMIFIVDGAYIQFDDRTNQPVASLTRCIMYYRMCTAANCSLYLVQRERERGEERRKRNETNVTLPSLLVRLFFSCFLVTLLDQLSREDKCCTCVFMFRQVK